ncbi:MAG TPA: hypothetical protein DD473_22835 [Planctomycetaceae bacterium]|nr:hypothetical protein [Planctomycetaceae bacterium]|tara:strand:- start:1451 stop:1678 length:228 start_codon:yes stop_codon:yes gene_type:complete
MMLFLKIVAAIFVAFFLLITDLYHFIRWKICSLGNTLKEVLKGILQLFNSSGRKRSLSFLGACTEKISRSGRHMH